MTPKSSSGGDSGCDFSPNLTAVSGPDLVPFTLNFTIINLRYMKDMQPPGSAKFNKIEKVLQRLVRVRLSPAPPTSPCLPTDAGPAHLILVLLLSYAVFLLTSLSFNSSDPCSRMPVSAHLLWLQTDLAQVRPPGKMTQRGPMETLTHSPLGLGPPSGPSPFQLPTCDSHCPSGSWPPILCSGLSHPPEPQTSHIMFTGNKMTKRSN